MHSDNQRWKTGEKVNARARQIDTLNVESEKKSFLRSRVLAIRSIHWNKSKRRKFAYSYQQQRARSIKPKFPEIPVQNQMEQDISKN